MNLLRRIPCLALTVLVVWGTFYSTARAQKDAMMQAFYWDVPVNASSLNGFWWDSLRVRAAQLQSAGFTGIWTPPPSKGAFSIYDMGYGLYDHYDLGEYSQKGNVSGIPASVETRFGSKQELINMVTEYRNRGMEVYTDVILNHLYGGNYEQNPSVKYYVEQQKYPSYPTSQLRWVLTNAQAGDHYLQIRGFNLDWNILSARAYELRVSWTSSDPNDPGPGTNPIWESEPNNGGGQFNVFPSSGRAIWAHIGGQSDVDEYKITLSSTATIKIQLIPKYDVSGQMNWASDDNGYRVSALWRNGVNQYSTIQLRTLTNFSYVTHTGGVPQWTWNYSSFHPVDSADFLQDQGVEDAIRPNWMLFGSDFNTYSALVKDRLKLWGQWLTNTVGYDGYRLDFVRGVQEAYVAEWLNAMPKKNNAQRFAVGEYWTGFKYRLKDWVNAISAGGAKSSVFDFPLRNDIKRMCNNDDNFQMSWLNYSGMIRDNTGNAISPDYVVTFLENHDTGKEHDKWVTRDWHMGYAYMMFAQGRPCVFYNHYFGDTLKDAGNPSLVVVPPATLRSELNKQIKIRGRYLDGPMEVVSATGDPIPSTRTANVFIARRQGNLLEKPGAVLVLNNHFTDTMKTWVTVNVSGWPYVTNQRLVNITSGLSQALRIEGDGRVELYAPPRGYAIWAIDTTFVPINFNVNVTTSVGENIYMVGDIAELGGWNTAKAIGPLDATNYPTWRLKTFYLPPNTTVLYKYIKKNASGLVTWETGNNHRYTTPSAGTATVNDTWGGGLGKVTDVESEAFIPETFALHSAFPNPFNPETIIQYDIPRDQTGIVTLIVYSLSGQAVRTLVNDEQRQGRYSVVWNGRNDDGNQVSSGTYFYRLLVMVSDGVSVFSDTKKGVLLK